MQNNLLCKKCGAKLYGDDIGATKKFINRGSVEYFCIRCLAQRFSVSEEVLKKKIEEYRAYGCALFVRSANV